ncbi:S8 family peptidase [Aneurinibacillus migulanus]|uniref:Subtilase family protein n=1 Tax=Aneurinibacillus migulanus TaxID=47500 RepID=A0A0D1Y0Y4_ANEMI|nr:S8 family peptidase [Aneurinibacillus migulanus]KIV52907.1 hypothetical protein TS65_22685 [Aneurinibacillus migulanus]KON95185.1 hypothetical protein AF333_06525 [Aneurinibacillus migulanus]MED0890922.1 S8 family peptidase [Aneurinibacillus migulanus]MED1616614.1 S8 family peptidase [Aneurinibacillus migulanus]SDI82676.1 Subtilase family protein [Aneurinibacillus migulanus]
MNPYQHLPLVQENINLTRQGKPDSRGDRIVYPPAHGAMLKKGFQERESEFKKAKKIGEDFIFCIVKDNSKHIKYSKLGLELLAVPSDTKVIVRVKNSQTFNSHLSDFTANKIAKKRALNYSEFANLNEFVFLTPEEKKGPLIKHEDIKTNELYTIDVQLYTGNDSLHEIYNKVNLFRDFLRELEVSFIDDCILSNLALIRISILGKNIHALLEHHNVYTIDLPQQSTHDYESVRNIGVDELPEVIPAPEDGPFIAIIDSGVLSSHPLLKGTVYDSAAFGGLDDPADKNGHGTMVAGITQYGDVYATLQQPSPLMPQFRLLNGRVTNENNEFSDEKILASVVKEAIEYFASDNYNCKIFNISLGDTRIPYQQQTKMDPWSYIIDSLNHKYNIAVVISSGNYFPEGGEEVLEKYMEYLLHDPEASVIPPAIAISGLTVGSKAKEEVPYISPYSRRKLQYRAIAKKEHISPFSRSGYGYANSIKPETISYGGNFSLNTQVKQINFSDRNLGIFSTSIFDGNDSWFEVRSGTSFAAPYIAHLLGRIKREIPTAKGNLLRALLINTATIETQAIKAVAEKFSNTISKPSELKTYQTRLSGYGEVREQILTNSYDHYVTMYHEGQIEVDKVSVFEIPIPDEVYNKKGKTKIHISLAYNPPCRDSRIDYVGTKMSFTLYRGLSLDEIKRYTCKPDDDEFEKDSLPTEKKRCKCNLSPSMTEVQRGTLLKATHTIAASKRSREDYGDTYYLVVKCAKRWYEGNEKQNYAIVVSLEHENVEAKLYDSVSNRINQRIPQRTRGRLK